MGAGSVGCGTNVDGSVGSVANGAGPACLTVKGAGSVGCGTNVDGSVGSVANGADSVFGGVTGVLTTGSLAGN